MAHSEQHFKYTTSRNDIWNFMMFKVFNKFYYILSIKTFSKPICSQGKEKCLTMLKKLRDKHVICIDKNLEIQMPS